jgi:hypothetical protein
MSTVITEADLQQQAGTFRLTSEEIEELDQADIEAEEDDRAGRLRPIEELLAKLGRSR